ncbi:MAG: NAD-dependent epimerase/dehydratase family protein [Oscillospiraceae bacterium]|nr:NAD-dependent epimerase/dehydratase family protein [Oscillospiraceae bacterium]
MKKIMITGANSYIGTSFERYIKEYFPNDYSIDITDVTEKSWREKSFIGYDSILHVAGIAHQKETKDNVKLYYEINRDLAVEIAKKAKMDGVKQFVFISSMSVYGMNAGVITKETIPEPKSNYGKSKLQAEKEIKKLENTEFKVCILRPPMVYGKGCKGNFNKIKEMVKKLPFFPYIKNERSMIYVDNLSSFIKMCIDKNVWGLYFPQNRFYISTMDIAKNIALAMNKKIYFDYLTGLAVWLLRLFSPLIKKAFGSLIYKDISDFDFSYIIVENEQSLIQSV